MAPPGKRLVLAKTQDTERYRSFPPNTMKTITITVDNSPAALQPFKIGLVFTEEEFFDYNRALLFCINKFGTTSQWIAAIDRRDNVDSYWIGFEREADLTLLLLTAELRCY